VVYVLPELVHAYRELGPRRMDSALAEREVLQSLRALHPPHRHIDVEYRVCRGPAAGEIIALARTLKPDLIVMGTHGRRGVGRLLLGSVTEAVLRRALCPVLTVREPVPAPCPAAPAAREPAHA
jgi:nucleotide-binding universal stress UspA family protein